MANYQRKDVGTRHLGHAQRLILAWITANPGHGTSAICRAVRGDGTCDFAMVSHTLGRLVRRGLVERRGSKVRPKYHAVAPAPEE